MKYKHTIQITLDTQFPQSSEGLIQLLQGMIGPWCIEAKVVKLNDRDHAYTSEELDPNSVGYVGHTIAREEGVPCSCHSRAGVIDAGSNMNCPWHGR